MSVLVVLAAAAGLLLAFSGVPAFRSGRLAARVEPYLSGLRGRPSSLLVRPSTSRRARLGRRVERVLESAGIGRSRDLVRRLEAAGLEPDPAAFRLDQFVWALSALIGSWALVALELSAGIGFDLRAIPLLSAVAFAGGFLGRDWWLGRQIEARRAALQEELPTAIDLVTLSIMSGESVPAAFARVAGILRSALGAEFEKAVSDMRAGATTVDALEELKARVDLAGVARLVDALITGIQRGTPLADVLRGQAEDGREARRRYLLELGGRREVLMLIPVVFLIMPVVVLFALYPGLVSLELLVP